LVFARADAGGRLLASGGRVEIRYRPGDGRRYAARAENLKITDATPLPDETCAPADEAPKSPPAAGGARRGGARKKKTASAAGSDAHPTVAAPGSVLAYADGACSGNPGPAGIGVVVLDGETRTEVSEYLGVGTNNIAELTAIGRVLEIAVDPRRPLLIYTDSSYSIGVLQKGWRAKANVDLVADLKRRLAERSATRLAYVPGHAGVALNERADALARQAVKERASRTTVLPAGSPA
jgi:ribonuclease HI